MRRARVGAATAPSHGLAGVLWLEVVRRRRRSDRVSSPQAALVGDRCQTTVQGSAVASSAPKRRRGPHHRKPWSRRPEDGLSVLRLPLDISDPVQRHRLQAVFPSAFQIKRARHRAARTRLRAYRAAHRERKRDAFALRKRLKLRARKEMEYRAYAHLDAAPHLRDHVTKALAMHLADSVWTPVERYLFPDASGKRQGIPGVGRWQDFTRIAGRARRHEAPRSGRRFDFTARSPRTAPRIRGRVAFSSRGRCGPSASRRVRGGITPARWC